MSDQRVMEAEINTLESRTDTTKTAIMRSIAAIKQQVIDERECAAKLTEELAAKVAEIAKLRADIFRLIEESKVLEEIRQALDDTHRSLKI